VILLAASSSLAASSGLRDRRARLEKATSPLENRVWGFSAEPKGRLLGSHPLRRRTATGYRGYRYKTASGRRNFLQSDPIRFKGGDANIYRYVGNGVLSWIDPFGLSGTLTIKTMSTGTTGGFPTGSHSWVEFKNDKGGATGSLGTFMKGYGDQKQGGGVQVNTEVASKKWTATESRSAHLDDAQEQALADWVKGQQALGEGAYSPKDNNCANFAANAWQKGTGEALDPAKDGIMGVATPKGLGTAIREANGGKCHGAK